MDQNENDRLWMEEAFRLAGLARGRTAPNPLVGAVVVSNGRVVGRGYHACCGEPHAERVALDEAGELARGATLYVTLEPCSVHGRTPPCTEAIVGAGVSRVVAPLRDPNPDVNGSGFRTLRARGIEVDVGLLEERAERENAGYLTYRRTGLPYVRLKLACSLDGRISGPLNGTRAISCRESQREVHSLRGSVDGVLVGIGTVLADDPQLTDRRDGAGQRQPRRFVLDTEARLPLSAALVRNAGDIETYVVCAADADPGRIRALERLGLHALTTPRGRGGVDLTGALRRIGQVAALDLLCEGGGGIATSLVRDGLVDRITLYIAPRLLGEEGLPSFGRLGAAELADGSALRNPSWAQSGTDMRFEADIVGPNETGKGQRKTPGEEARCSQG